MVIEVFRRSFVHGFLPNKLLVQSTDKVYNEAMRPYYESTNDRQHEAEVINLLCNRFALKPEKLKPSLEVDYALMDNTGKCAYVCEIKVRKKRYPDMFLSLAKVQALRAYAAIGINARILFALPDGVHIQKVAPLDIEGWIGYGGRSDRNDSQDGELLVFYPTDGMTRAFDSKKEWFL